MSCGCSDSCFTLNNPMFPTVCPRPRLGYPIQRSQPIIAVGRDWLLQPHSQRRQIRLFEINQIPYKKVVSYAQPYEPSYEALVAQPPAELSRAGEGVK